jgi:hypothetical protein
MPPVTRRSQQIKNLCESWIGATAQPDGGMAIGGQSEQFRLLNNDLVFHEFTHDELRAACIGLSTVLLRPGLNTVIDQDHFWFWSWCGELLAGPRSTYFSDDERELKDLLGLAVRAALAGTYRPDDAGWEASREARRVMDPNTRQLVQDSHKVLAHLTFPLLEGLLKKECCSFVGQDGTVLRDFSVPRPSGRTHDYKIGRRCSSVRDLLVLIQDHVATPELRADLDEQKSHLEAFAQPDEDGFDVVYRWRNSSLHGAASFPTIGGTMLNTALLVALPALAIDYESLSSAALEQARWEVQTGQLSSHRSPWSYYPPYV